MDDSLVALSSAGAVPMDCVNFGESTPKDVDKVSHCAK